MTNRIVQAKCEPLRDPVETIANEIFLNPLDWYKKNNIRLLMGNRAAGLLRRARLVYGQDGEPEPYDKLIIATGSRAFIPR